MAKTSIYKKYYTRIRAYNDQLWYYMFAADELATKLSRFSDEAKDLYTRDTFVGNQYASKIMVKLKNLPTHEDKSQKLMLGSTISVCYEIAGDYLEDVFGMLKTYNALPLYNWNPGVTPEENLVLLFQRNGIARPNQSFFDTLTYIRHRRNHFIHLWNVPNGAFGNFVVANGAGLNLRWRTPGVVVALDFTAVANVSQFDLTESIEIIKLIGICITEIDRRIAAILNINEVIKALATDQFGAESVRMNNDVARQRSQRLIQVARAELGLAVTQPQCDPFVRRVGIR